MRPKLSIVTPTLNQGPFIERTIRSVLDQGYENLEYGIVDGGSTDETLDIIRRYEDRLAWWISEPDDGQTDAIAKGLRRCTGDVIAYINSDDYYLPGAFDTAIEALERSGAEWVAGAARFVDEHDRETHVWRPAPPRDAESLPPGRQWWVLTRWMPPQPSTFWRRSVFDALGGFRTDMHYVFDVEFALRIAYSGRMPYLLSDVLSVRVVHPKAKSWSAKPFNRESRRLIRIVRPQLTSIERRRLWISWLALKLAPVIKVVGPLVPDRFRPKARA